MVKMPSLDGCCTIGCKWDGIGLDLWVEVCKGRRRGSIHTAVISRSTAYHICPTIFALIFSAPSNFCALFFSIGPERRIENEERLFTANLALYSVLGGVREDSSCKYLPPTFHRQVAQYSPCQRWLVGCHYLYKTFYEGQKPNFGQLDMVDMDGHCGHGHGHAGHSSSGWLMSQEWIFFCCEYGEI